METATKRRTVEDGLAGLDAWDASIDASPYSHATPEWKERAHAVVARQRARLSEFSPDMALLSLTEAIASPLLTVEEQTVIRWQHQRTLDTGAFWAALFDAVTAADDRNMERLIVAFPELAGIHRYRREPGYSDAVRGLPIDFDL